MIAVLLLLGGAVALLVMAVGAAPSPGPLRDAMQDKALLHREALPADLPADLPEAQFEGRERLLLQSLPPPDAAGWQPASLPALKQAPLGDSVAGSSLSVWWYRVQVVVPALPADGTGARTPMVLYVPRVSGGAVLLAQHGGELGGETVSAAPRWQLRWDGSAGWREQWNRPIWVDLGAQAPGTRLTLALGIVRAPERSHRLSRLYVGPRELLTRRLELRLLLQQAAPQVASLTFLALGLVALIYWLGRRGNRPYLLFALTSVAWTLRNLHYYVQFPTSDTSLEWFWWMSNASLSWVMVLMYMFAIRFDRRRHRGLERALVAFVVIATLLAMPGSPLRAVSQVHLVNAMVALGVGLTMGWLAWHDGGRDFRLITLALWVTNVFGLHDLLLVSGAITPESVYLLPFAMLLMFLAFLHAAQHRYSMAMDQVAQANTMLEQQLATREAELRTNHEKLRAVEREQALLLERQRLMRDMHDGLGSTLMSSLVLVEQGRLEAPAVALLLRECVDDLRLVIDSLEPIGHDLITLLALLRHRLGRRLEAAGLQLAWEVDDLPPLNWLYPPDALQILRAVQEVLTNVLKHAGAQHIRIATLQLGDRVEVLIEDDGCGFDTEEAPRGRGLRHLAQRAARLGGEVHIDSAPGRGTRVRLHLPLQRDLAA
ncbi:sensor histidine kinase [Ideonella azotifigens]|uniref:histidine kinase n=3 Tax=Ideonella azotifigens TaxID=513160 RepID=A0ABN1KM58_9BURK